MPTYPELRDKVAIVTGAAGGIGQALVRAFVQAGMRVAACDVDAAGLDRLRAELGDGHLLPLTHDVGDPAACEDAVRQAVGRFGRLDLLVNNAALGMSVVRRDHMTRQVRIEDITVETWQSFMRVNLSGAFFMAKAAVPLFRRQAAGRIVNVTTSFFTMLRGGFSPYGPAKAGLEAWSRSLAEELRGSGITVNVVVPGGPADTPMVPEESGMDRAALIRPECMAPPILWLASDAAAAVTGRRYVAAHWDPSMPAEQAERQAGAAVAWPDLAQAPVWPGGKPKGA